MGCTGACTGTRPCREAEQQRDRGELAGGAAVRHHRACRPSIVLGLVFFHNRAIYGYDRPN